MRAPFPVLALLAAVALGCAPDFLPRSVLDPADPRVLALVQDPPELVVDPADPGPGPAVNLAAVPWGYGAGPPDPTAAARSWSFCPYSLGSSVGYACIVPACEQPIDPARSKVDTWTAHPLQLTRDFLACAAGQPGGLPSGLPPGLPPTVQMVFRYTVGSGALQRSAVQVFPVHTRPQPIGWVANRLPGLAAIEIGGAQVWPATVPPAAVPHLSGKGGVLDVCLQFDPASAESYVDPAGQPQTETLVASFYTTEGRFDFDRANGPSACVKLKAEKLTGASQAELWVVGRDLRGGTVLPGCEDPAACAPVSFRVPIDP